MTERERMIELSKIPYEVCKNTSCNTCEDKGKHYCFLEKYADSLLAHGVIVLPVNVGDIVFCSYDNEVSEQKVTNISCDISGTWMIFTECSVHGYGDIRHCEVKDFCGNGYCNYSFPMDSIGKTVFLAREEAEAAVKEREQK